MQIIDNIHQKLYDNLKNVIKKDSKVSIAAAYFSIYAYQELKEQLEQVEELQFLFTSPSFTSDKTKKEKREFYIPRLNREKSLYGKEFEVKLRNELTQKAIAKECVDWIKGKVQFKSNVTQEHISGFMNVNAPSDNYTYAPINGFTTTDLGIEKGNHMHGLVNRVDGENALYYKRTFDQIWNDKEKLQDVTDEVIDNITTVYKENSPEFIYFLTLYNIFNEFLDDISEDVLPNDATGFKESAIWNTLYDFQKEACLAIINKLEKYNGCILADSVGLGKTFTALSVIKYYENRNKSVLVLCPKKLSDNWNTYKHNLLNNPIAEDRLRYDVLYHTDLSRDKGYSNGIPLDRINWSNYDLVVIDESHNFRNGGQIYGENDEKENRYLKLLNRVIRQGVKTKVLMLSATPVNNRFKDLKNQLALAYEGEEDNLNQKLNTNTTIDTIFRRAQAIFNTWSELTPEKRTTDRLLRMLDFDFFELLDSVTIARSRKHIEQYYDNSEVSTFPERREPISIRCELSNIENLMDYNAIFEYLSMLNLGIYKPTDYILPSKISKYEKKYGTDMAHTRFKQSDREQGILVLMRTNLLKRLESSVYSFRLTMERMLTNINNTIQTVNDYRKGKILEVNQINSDDFDMDDQNTDFFSVGSKVKIILNDMDYQSWLEDLHDDKEILIKLIDEMKRVNPQNDEKLYQLIKTIEDKIDNPINEGNKKVIIFSAFSDTVEYLYKHVSKYFEEKYGLNSAMVSGGDGGANTIKGLTNDLNTVLTCFSPKSKDKELILSNYKEGIDILIDTDVISEGQNLQDCDYLINYDIHWNPVRIIQRFGRIDRIGSTNKEIQLVNFWPDMDLDDYINLKARVETRMKITVMTSTGDDNPIDDESGDLEYRKQQLQRLQKEVVDIEEMTSGVSIMDLGLNEFRIDLLSYIKEKPNLEDAPMGMHAIVPSSNDDPPGVIFILKNINNDINAKSQNRLYPFYLVYISEAGEVVHNHLDPKTILDLLRLKSKGITTPHMNLCRDFNKDTSDGRNMEKYSDLLQDTISSIINVNEESDIDSLFKVGGTTALRTHVKGLDDFELVSFMVVR